MSKTLKFIVIISAVVLVAGAAIYYFMFYKKSEQPAPVTPAAAPQKPILSATANVDPGKLAGVKDTPASLQDKDAVKTLPASINVRLETGYTAERTIA